MPVAVPSGECTLAIALYSAAVSHDDDVALLYFDGGQDLSLLSWETSGPGSRC